MSDDHYTEHTYQGAVFKLETLRAMIGQNSDDTNWCIVLAAEGVNGRKVGVTVGVMHDYDGAVRWAKDCIDAVIAGKPEPPDAYNRPN